MILNKINTSKKLVFVSFILFSILFFILNQLTCYAADDYRYMYSFADSSVRITSVWQIFPSMVAHYQTANGRVVAHFTVQLFLMIPKTVFNVCNTIVYMMLIYIIYRFSVRKKENLFLLWMITAALWYFTPAYGQVYLWLDGACNYLWPVTFCLYYLIPYHRLLRNETAFKNRVMAVTYVVLGVLIGAYSESASAVLLLVGAAAILMCFVKKGRCPAWTLLSECTLVAGYVFMMSSDGTKTSKISTISGFDVILNHFKTAYDMYIDYLIVLLVAFIALVVLYIWKYRSVAKKSREDSSWTWKGILNQDQTLIFALIYFFLSIAANFFHIMASYYPARSMLTCTIYLIISIGVLLNHFFESDWNCLPVFSGILIILLTVNPFFSGCRDIVSTYLDYKEREVLIQEAKDDGDMDIELPLISVQTKYSPKYSLKDLDLESSDSWPNDSMAKYYGVDSILGIDTDS